MITRFARVGLTALPTVAAAVLAAYAAELYFHLTGDRAVEDESRRDPRSRPEVVLDLRSQGTAAYPAIFPRALLQNDRDGGLHPVVEIDGTEVLPLGGISRVTTVTCNEGGQYAIVQSDEHGFNNPEGLWEAIPLQIIVVGDSYTYGNCVAAEDSFVARLRARYPATLNLGLGGAGPLIELAVLREYAKQLQPRLVLWVFYEGNDLRELEEERRSAFLMGQLAGEEPAGLHGRQSAVDAELIAFANDRLNSFSPPDPTIQILRLSKLRERLRFLWSADGELATPDADYDFGLLQEVLTAARSTTASWGGELYLVYLPGRDRYFGPAGKPVVNDRIRSDVTTAAHAAGLKVIDLVPVFSAHGSPAELFVDANSHLNETGYRFVGDAILRELAGTAMDLASDNRGAFDLQDAQRPAGDTLQ